MGDETGSGQQPESLRSQRDSPRASRVGLPSSSQHAIIWALSHLGYQTRIDDQGNVVVEDPERPPLDQNERRILAPTPSSKTARQLFH